MKSSLPFLVALAGPLATLGDAHTIFTTLFVNDKTQGDGTCVRMNQDSENCTSPVPDLSSDDMACGVTGMKPVSYTCPAPAGSKITFEWRLYADLEKPGSLDQSHKGPCAVYAKQISDMATDSAAGSGWFKLWDEGYDESSGKWCTEKLIDNNGLMSIEIPTGLPGGNWLFRPELLALHNADKGDPQFYTGCAQVFVESEKTGTLDVPADFSVSIPGYVKAGEPSVSFNIYNPVFPYPIPGPKVYNVPSSSTRKREALVQTEGVIPPGCLIKNANWCGLEVSDYSTENGCWKASEECYNKGQTCYDSAPPTGDMNCKVWEAKCKEIQDECSAGKFTGPPNKGIELTSADPPAPDSIPAGLKTGNGAYDGGSASTGSNTSSLNALHTTAADSDEDDLAGSGPSSTLSSMTSSPTDIDDGGSYNSPTTLSSMTSSPTHIDDGSITLPTVISSPTPTPDDTSDDISDDTLDVTSDEGNLNADPDTSDDTSDDATPDDTPDDTPDETSDENTLDADPDTSDDTYDTPDESPDEIPEDDSGSSQSALVTSTNGTCGGDTGFTCKGSLFGNCCSKSGHCGNSSSHCKCSCQSACGDCRRSKRGHHKKH